jgi:hypothetical protein
MDHNEAIKQMATERYLLGELTPELRESFEEHAFDCPECSLDLRAGAAFIQAAKAELPGVVEQARTAEKPALPKKAPRWSSWLQPAWAVPAFAILLFLIAYQNFLTIPALRHAAGSPRILPSVAFHAGTRGAPHLPVVASRDQGAVISIELPQVSAIASYGFQLYDPSGKEQWSQTITASSTGDGTVSLVIPGTTLQQGPYTLAISGITAQGGRTEIERRVLDIQLAE